LSILILLIRRIGLFSV